MINNLINCLILILTKRLNKSAFKNLKIVRVKMIRKSVSGKTNKITKDSFYLKKHIITRNEKNRKESKFQFIKLFFFEKNKIIIIIFIIIQDWYQKKGRVSRIKIAYAYKYNL
jgi:hypothetical protein